MANVNDLTFNQISTVLNSIVAQATGKTPLTPTNTSEFISVAQTALKQGYDPLTTAISQVLSRTIFSNRPYSRKFKGIEASQQRFGNITRKLSIVDKPMQDDSRFKLVEGASIDMYNVNKPSILQTNFYGANTYEKQITIYRDQLDCAFNSPEEFASFIAMVTTNASDQLEQAREDLARMCIANYITGKVQGEPNNTIHLITEYNALTDLELTIETIYLPENFRPFMQWVYSRIATLSELMSERSAKFHFNITQFGGTRDAATGVVTGGTDKTVMRHTPIAKQKVYIHAPAKFQTSSMVLANTYNPSYVTKADNEAINFWQSIDTPDLLNVKPSYLASNGDVITTAASVPVNKIFGVIFDEEALGYTLVNQWSAPTPFNAKGGYTNIFYHETARYWNDFTENGIVLLLD